MMAGRTSTKSNMNGDNSVKLAVMQNDISYIKDEIHSINDKVSNGYVSKDEFRPVKNVVYGLVTLILVAVVGAIMALVVRQ